MILWKMDIWKSHRFWVSHGLLPIRLSDEGYQIKCGAVGKSQRSNYKLIGL